MVDSSSGSSSFTFNELDAGTWMCIPFSKWIIKLNSVNIYPLVNKHSYWKWWFIVDLPIKNGDVPSFFVCLPFIKNQKNSLDLGWTQQVTQGPTARHRLGFRGTDFFWRCALLSSLRGAWSSHAGHSTALAYRDSPEELAPGRLGGALVKGLTHLLTLKSQQNLRFHPIKDDISRIKYRVFNNQNGTVLQQHWV